MFPPSVVGGPSKKETAAELVELHVGFGEPVHTDIAGDKKIFRQRRWVGTCFERHNLKPGDKIVVEEIGDLTYHIYPQRRWET